MLCYFLWPRYVLYVCAWDMWQSKNKLVSALWWTNYIMKTLFSHDLKHWKCLAAYRQNNQWCTILPKVFASPALTCICQGRGDVVCPPFAALIAAPFLGRLSTRFRSVPAGIIDHSFNRWGEKAWLSVCTPPYPKGVLSGFCAGRSSSSAPNSLINVLMDLALCTGAQSCWKRKGPSANCSHKVMSMESSKLFWHIQSSFHWN